MTMENKKINLYITSILLVYYELKKRTNIEIKVLIFQCLQMFDSENYRTVTKKLGSFETSEFFCF